jgi:hypothetical protein
MVVRHQKITLVSKTNHHATRQRDSPSRRLRGIKCHFQVFHSRTFVALSLYLSSLASLPRLRLLFDCEKPFFLVYNFEGLSGRISSLFCFYPWISHGEFLQTRKFLLLLLPPLHLCFIVFVFLVVSVYLGRSLFSGLFVVWR